MNINVMSIAGICITATILCGLFSNFGKEYALYIKLAAATAVLSIIVICVAPITETINSLYAKAGADEEYLTVLFKALGICYLTQFACDMCKDSGEAALATQAELAGKIALLILALPLFNSLADIVINLI